MGMTEIAERAIAARNALADLANSVAKLPPPVFNFARSIDLLGQLADWADRGRQDPGFNETEALNRALVGTLEKGSDGRRAVPAVPAKESKTAGGYASEVLSDPSLSPRQKIGRILAQKGGESRSAEKVAAAKANMQIINEKRWGRKRMKSAKRRIGRGR